MTVATCGNYGVAMALAASLAGLRCLVYIPAGYHTRRLDEIERWARRSSAAPGDYEDAVGRLQARPAEERSLRRQSRRAPTRRSSSRPTARSPTRSTTSCATPRPRWRSPSPTARRWPGSTAASSACTAAARRRAFRGSSPGSSYSKNPIVEAVPARLDACDDLDPATIHETEVNEPLVNWHSIDGDPRPRRRSAARSGWAAVRLATGLCWMRPRMVREKEGLNVLPASTAGLLVLLERHREEPLPGDRYVAVLTGRRS